MHGLDEIPAALDPRPTGSRDSTGEIERVDEENERERRRILEWGGDHGPGLFDRRTVNHFLVPAGARGALDG